MTECFLIEDDVDDQEIFFLALHAVDRNINCEVAYDGYEGIERLKSDEHFKPSYIFIDVNMPKINGIECLRALRQIERLGGCRIIMYSTSEDQKIVMECMELGANDFILKPPSLDSLKEILSRLLTTNDLITNR